MSDAFNLVETQLETRSVYQGSFLNVRSDTVQLPDGRSATREYVVHPGAVVIIPVFDDDTVLVERQYRYPVGRIEGSRQANLILAKTHCCAHSAREGRNTQLRSGLMQVTCIWPCLFN